MLCAHHGHRNSQNSSQGTRKKLPALPWDLQIDRSGQSGITAIVVA